MVVGKIVDGGGDHAHIKHCTPGGIEPGCEVITQDGRVRTRIVADGNDFAAAYFLTEVVPYEFDALFIQFFVKNTSDIIFAKNGLVDRH